jgi:adenylylsulfate kinase-like enzyme
MREFARTRIGRENFIEVYVKASLETCIRRDPKGLYKKAIDNQIPEFTGLTSAYEEPLAPDIIIDTEENTVRESADLLATFVLKQIDNQR